LAVEGVDLVGDGEVLVGDGAVGDLGVGGAAVVAKDQQRVAATVIRRELDGETMTAYGVTVTREDDLWVAVVDRLPKGVIRCSRLRTLRRSARRTPELIADLTDSDPSQFTLTWRYEINGRDVTPELRRFLALEEDVRRVQQDRMRARKDALAALTDAGLSRRVMADVVQLSHQRVQQLVSDAGSGQVDGSSVAV
jgi:hypothetical protein